MLERDKTIPPKRGTRVRWLCACDCGKVTSVTGHELQSGDTTSCGCYRRDKTAAMRLIHGMSRTPTHNSWRAMRSRCLDPKNEKFSEYGGRGIQVCERWASFEAFYLDMGERPPKKTLDRIDPSKGYYPQNCRWASAKTQAENRRGVGHMWKGQIRTVADIARLEGVPRTSLQKRIKVYGDAVDAAVIRLRSLR